MNIKAMNKKELLKLCAERELEVTDEMSKDDIIELLEQNADIEDRVVDNIIVREESNNILNSHPMNKTQETIKIIKTGECIVGMNTTLRVKLGDVLKVDRGVAAMLRRRGFSL